MNEVLANIYGTGGFEKTASAEHEGLPDNLTELATMLAVQGTGGDDLQKTASVRDNVLGKLVSFDAAGRALCHQEYALMEKAAAEGNPEALQEFWADVQFEGEHQQASQSDLRGSIAAELARRKAQK